MTSITPDGARAEIRENALVAGNPVKTSAKVAQADALLYADSNGQLAESSVTASTPLYVDSSKVPQSGDIPFAFPVTAASTTAALIKLTGTSTLSATGPLTNTIVAGAAVSTFTASGYARVQLVDNGGNVTNSNYYIQFGTLA